MPRSLAPCGTHAAYKRHLRAGEKACDACRVAARDYTRRQREKAAYVPAVSREPGPAEVARAARESTDDRTALVSVLVGYGRAAEVEIPLTEDPAASIRWALRRVRAALMVATPRDVAALAKADRDLVADLAELTAARAPAKVSALDQLAERRAARRAGHGSA